MDSHRSAPGTPPDSVTAPRVSTLANAIFISSAENVQHVLKDQFECYVKGKVTHDMLGDFLGDGIFVTDGEKWKHHRKACLCW